MSTKRILAISLRHILLMRRDLTRLSEIIWFPVIDLAIWGLVTTFISSQSGLGRDVFSYLIGGMMLWVFVYRMQMSISISILVDMWERNFLNIFTSPITTLEYIIGLTVISSIKLIVTGSILVILSFIFYSFNIFILGLYLVPFVFSLMFMGWWMGTVINGLLLRFGFKIEAFAWALVYVFNPLSGVFFPLSVMPDWMRAVAQLLPSSYIFEGMRQVIDTGRMDALGLVASFGLNIVYSIMALFVYYSLFRSSLKSGILVKLSD